MKLAVFLLLLVALGADCRQSCCQNTNCCNSCCQNTNCCNSCSCDDCSEPCPPTPAPPRPSPPVIVNVTNANNNNFTVGTVVNLENVIKTENVITVPLNVTVKTTNNVIVQPESSKGSCSNSNEVFVPVYVPLYVPVPARGCCNVIQPCVPYGCPWMGQTRCGCACQSPFMFQPVDPCRGGCYRAQQAHQSWCLGPNFCRQVPVDCSTCPENFYSDYATFARCGGCFRPAEHDLMWFFRQKWQENATVTAE